MMQAMTERFEMRLDADTQRAIDGWRAGQPDVPSRAEAIRRLIERGLANPEDELRFSGAEMLIVHMLCDLFTSLKIKSEVDPKFVKSALLGGHFWGLRWRYANTLHRHIDSPDVVKEVVDILDMWHFIESTYKKLGAKDKERLKKEAEPFGANPRFRGFDGNNESEHIAVTHFLIEDLERFSRFKDRPDLNSHMPSLGGYRRMLEVFLPIRQTLAGGGLSVGQLVQILSARTHASYRKDETQT